MEKHSEGAYLTPFKYIQTGSNMEIGEQATNPVTSLFLLSCSYGILKKYIINYHNTENGSFNPPLCNLDIDALDYCQF